MARTAFACVAALLLAFACTAAAARDLKQTSINKCAVTARCVGCSEAYVLPVIVAAGGQPAPARPSNPASA